jgi:FdhD protein
VSLSDAPVRRPTTSVQVVAYDDGNAQRRPDELVTEEPLEIRVHGPGQDPEPLAVTMRTPGNDFELAAGFCLTEGVLRGGVDLAGIEYCLGGEGEQLYNVVTVRLRTLVGDDVRSRRFLANSSCGICGKAALDDIEVRCDPIAAGPKIAASLVATLPERLAQHQRVFGRTGGLHAAARFVATGELVAVREDVGRHNALDKLVGNALLDGALPLANDIVMVSGRVSFELVQKAAVAGVPVICAVSAPSSLAIAAAERFGQTVVGFVRDGRFNVYARADRIAMDR